MSGLFSYGSSTTQRTGNDAIYGQGTDGDVTITGNTTLTSDKYYNNLTVNGGVTLTCSGYKIFVKNTLTLNGTISVNTGTTTGTIFAVTTSSNVSNVLGGIGAGSSANSAPSWVTENIYGLVLDSSPVQVGGLASVRGGSAGIAGNTGSTVPAYTNSDTWSGKAGTAGSAGNYAPNANTEGASGGKGYTGNSGTATGATAGVGGAGGTGGNGGALAVIIAKNITGTGTISAIGFSGSAGSAGSTGSPGTAGNTGATAPTLTVNAGTNSTAVIAGCNNHTSPANTANCATHGHVQSNHHTHTQSNHHHTVQEHHTVRDSAHHSYCSQHHPNGHCINHAHAQSNHHYHVAGAHHYHVRSNSHHTVRSDQHHTVCNAHNSTHANHICNTNSSYAGGAGGAGGAAAPAVTGDTGQAGYNGGGGAIIVITEPFRYFEVAPVGVEVSRTWATDINSNRSTVVSGADGTAIGTGAQNTIDIVAQSGNVAATSAAVYCSELTYGGYSDWFLPSKDELNQMYVNKTTTISGSSFTYWSSSENDANNAWSQNFFNGPQSSSLKSSTTPYVRPVRSFLSTATYAIGDTGPAGGKIFITPSTSPLSQITTSVAAGTGGTGTGGAGNVYVILNK
jgi:hypothetical protein